MKQYLLSIYHPDEPIPDAEVMEKIYRDVSALNDELRESGAWVFAAGLHPSTTATVLQVRGDGVLVTDGPFAESKEHIGGFWVIKAPDLDSALEWGRKATRACTAPVEVRPVREDSEAEA